MNNLLSQVGLTSISLFVLYIIKKIFDSNNLKEESKFYKFDEDDESQL